MPNCRNFVTLLAGLILTVSVSPRLVATTRGLTAIPGVKVGHHTLDGRPTGCTVILFENGAIGAVDIRGGAPGTRETALLDPVNVRVQRVHGIALSGGSAFGLATADGVMRYLDERGIGFKAGENTIPIVPAAVLYDLNVGDPTIRPTAECGYKAASEANVQDIPEGNVGAGAGATVGKIGGQNRAMKGGVGTALIELPNGLKVAALMAVNAVGDIIDPETGAIVAGTRTRDGRGFADARMVLRQQSSAVQNPPNGQNTTIGVVVTNGTLTPAELSIVARMAQSGLARAIRPAHTPADGDTIFVLATGTRTEASNLLSIGALAADATADAIIRAVRAAISIPGYPASRDF
jgi:L-aminopeptidase/D-esterase-like protein